MLFSIALYPAALGHPDYRIRSGFCRTIPIIPKRRQPGPTSSPIQVIDMGFCQHFDQQGSKLKQFITAGFSGSSISCLT
jgi:hypothetical protein